MGKDVKAQHTPGPWFVVPWKYSIGVCTKANGKSADRVAECDYWTHGSNQPDRKTAEANACLISAAPDLLEALQLADAFLRGANINMNALERKATAAIAKARAALKGGRDD